MIFATFFASSKAGCLATQSTPPSYLKPPQQETGAGADMNQTHCNHVRKTVQRFHNAVRPPQLLTVFELRALFVWVIAKSVYKCITREIQTYLISRALRDIERKQSGFGSNQTAFHSCFGF